MSKPFDIADQLNSEEEIRLYLQGLLDEGHPELLPSALGDIMRSQGMKEIAEKMRPREKSLYKSFRPGAKPRFETVIKALQALGLSLSLGRAA